MIQICANWGINLSKGGTQIAQICIIFALSKFEANPFFPPVKQLAWPMAERSIEHRKSCLVLSARFPVVNRGSRPVAKSAYFSRRHRALSQVARVLFRFARY